MLEEGADVNAQGGEDGNALCTACSRGHKEIAGMLLEKGADVNAQGGEDGNALYAACSRGHKEIAWMSNTGQDLAIGALSRLLFFLNKSHLYHFQLRVVASQTRRDQELCSLVINNGFNC